MGHVDGMGIDPDTSSCRGFLGLFNLSKGLRCGVSSWPCSPPVPFTLVLIIVVLFGMLVV